MDASARTASPSSGAADASSALTPKSSAVASRPNSEMEMGALGGDGPGAVDDIMQIARIGDVPAMERLFEAGEFDATYTDEEGITPLHVSLPGGYQASVLFRFFF